MIRFLCSQTFFTFLSFIFCLSIHFKTHSFEQSNISQKDLKLSHFQMALGLPHPNRMAVLKSWPKKQVEKKLGTIIFSKKQNLKNRWRALTALAKIQPNSLLIKRALESNHWFLRNSALISLKSAPRKKALEWAKKLLFDPALVVRTSAVAVIRHHKGIEARTHLVEALSNRQNFRNGKGLWVRGHISETLKEFDKF